MKPSPAPWTVEPDCTRSADDAYYYVQDANGQTLFDSFTSDVKEIHSEHDESGTTYWDEQGKVNLTLAAAAPKLLAACKRLVETMFMISSGSLELAAKYGPDFSPPDEKDIVREYEHCCAVIKEAEGQR